MHDIETRFAPGTDGHALRRRARSPSSTGAWLASAGERTILRHMADLACDLGALTPDERNQRAALASRVTARFREVRETADGYAARLDPDPVLVRDAFDWTLLEHRCCPFLRLELRFEPSPGPVWLGFGGGPGVKEFLAAAGLRPSPSCGERC